MKPVWSRVAVRRVHRAPPTAVFIDSQDLPKDVSAVPTHVLLQKLGFVRPTLLGLVHWLPTGLSVLTQIETVVRRHMAAAGAHEVSLSLLSLAALWKQTNRWNNPEWFKLKDSGGAEFCLAPTAEEEITALVGLSVRSPRNLPLVVYQISRKYRDELRPRAGLLRGREFVMKDAYLFDTDSAGAGAAYDKMVAAYRAIFTELRVPFVMAEADTGAIGGSQLHEWHYLHPSGEDHVLECGGCGAVANAERMPSWPPAPAPESPTKSVYFDRAGEWVRFQFPSLREFLPSLAAAAVPGIDLASECTVLPAGAAAARTVSDPRVVPSTGDVAPVVHAHDGDTCGKCRSGTLRSQRAIEVGHTFNLGTKYLEPLGAVVPGSSGKHAPLAMGCYGIGISRLVAAIAEVLRDNRGLVWPAVIAPFHLTAIDSNTAESTAALALSVLRAQQQHPWLRIHTDTRPKKVANIGRKFADSTLSGVPLVVVAGRLLPRLEIEVRGKRWGSGTWEAVHAHNAAAWLWDVSHANGTERHVFDGAFLGEVCAALLADM